MGEPRPTLFPHNAAMIAAKYLTVEERERAWRRKGFYAPALVC